MRSRKRYTHIFFDLDNTLWDYGHNSRMALMNTFLHFQMEKQLADVELFFTAYSNNNRLLWKKYRNAGITKKNLIIQRFGDTFGELGIRNMDPEEVNRFYLSEMVKQDKLVEGAKELLDYLERKGYKMYIISNGFKEAQKKKMDNTGLARYFDRIIVSEVVKASKPDREIFEYAVKSVNAKKSESLMIGDDLETDIRGANRFGMDAVHLVRGPETENVPAKVEKKAKNISYTVKNLRQVAAIL